MTGCFGHLVPKLGSRLKGHLEEVLCSLFPEETWASSEAGLGLASAPSNWGQWSAAAACDPEGPGLRGGVAVRDTGRADLWGPAARGTRDVWGLLFAGQLRKHSRRATPRSLRRPEPRAGPGLVSVIVLLARREPRQAAPGPCRVAAFSVGSESGVRESFSEFVSSQFLQLPHPSLTAPPIKPIAQEWGGAFQPLWGQLPQFGF